MIKNKNIDSQSLQRNLEVITTHINADFDALASMLAAAKLYPKAWLVFPGARERTLRNFFVESTCYFYNFVKIKQLSFNLVKRLILVDTRQKDRLGPLGELAENPQIDIHAYDHHPDTDNDVKTSYQLVESVGATVTILSRILRDKNLILTEDEATLLALGIYEDTGSFTFASTTFFDFEAAAWLLSQGANLSLLSSFINREMNIEEVSLLNNLIKSAQRTIVNGVEIIISEVSCERYIPELAVLVHKFMEMDKLNVLLVLACMEERVHLVARSRLAAVDVGTIAKIFGGGGHSSAASATIHNLTLSEVRERLLAVLFKYVNPRIASDFMTKQVISLEPQATINQAQDLLTRHSINLVLIVDNNKIFSVISRQTVEKAILHGLGSLPVSDYMDQRVQSLQSNASLQEVEQIVLQHRYPLVPVLDGVQLIGVITRTNLFNILIDDSRLSDSDYKNRFLRKKSVVSFIQERLPQYVLNILIELGRLADELDYNIYLVGGGVRDLFLRRSNLDLDIVVEGEGILFARAFAQGRPEIRIREHKKFNTAKIIFKNGQIIDVVTARREYYKAPATLPIIESTSIKPDLYRRDFTINTLAICINSKNFGILYDYFNGIHDLKEKTVRVLHGLSFVEDPTRVFRAVRFEQRFGFKISKLTTGLIKNAIKIDIFQSLSGKRLFAELIQILEEECAIDCLNRLNELKLLSIFHPKLKLENKELFLLKQVQESLVWFNLSFLGQSLRRWLVIFLGLIDILTEQEVEAVTIRLNLGSNFKTELKEMRSLALASLNRLQRLSVPFSLPSAVYFLLKPLRIEYQLYIMAKSSMRSTKKAISQYISRFQKVRSILTGEDLKRLGYKPGPLFKTILIRLQTACLDGEVVNREEEVLLLQKEFSLDYRKTMIDDCS